MLLPRRRKIQRDSIELECHRAEAPMRLNTTDAFGADLAAQFRHKRCGVSFHHPVQIRNTRPGAAPALMKKLIADNSTDQCQTRDSQRSRRPLQRLQNGRRHSRQIHVVACRTMK